MKDNILTCDICKEKITSNTSNIPDLSTLCPNCISPETVILIHRGIKIEVEACHILAVGKKAVVKYKLGGEADVENHAIWQGL